MPPKKDAKKDKKADADAPDPKQVIGAFTKDYVAQNAALGVEPLKLNTGDGSEVFRKMLVHPQEGMPTCSPLQAKALVGALTNYAHLQTLALWSVNLQEEGTKGIANYLGSNRTLISLELTEDNLPCSSLVTTC